MCRFGSTTVPCLVSVLCGVLNLSQEVREEAKQIGCKVVGAGLLRKPLPVVAATSVYIACRETHTPVTIEELALASHEDSAEIGHCYRQLVDRLGIVPGPPDATEYLQRVVTKLGLSKKVAALSVEIERRAAERGVAGRKPMTLAAAAVYAACKSAGEEMTQSDVAEAAGVSVISLRDCSKAMRNVVP